MAEFQHREENPCGAHAAPVQGCRRPAPGLASFLGDGLRPHSGERRPPEFQVALIRLQSLGGRAPPRLQEDTLLSVMLGLLTRVCLENSIVGEPRPHGEAGAPLASGWGWGWGRGREWGWGWGWGAGGRARRARCP